MGGGGSAARLCFYTTSSVHLGLHKDVSQPDSLASLPGYNSDSTEEEDPPEFDPPPCPPPRQLGNLKTEFRLQLDIAQHLGQVWN